MALSLTEFMAKVSELVIAHETEFATRRQNSRKRELEELPAELAAQETKLAELQADVEQAKQNLQDAERAGLDGIKDPFEVFKHWAEKHNAWRGWEGEVTSPRNIPPISWVRRSRNLDMISFSQYERMWELAKQGKRAVLKEHLEHLRQDLEKAQEKADKVQQSYDFDRERYERLQRQVRDFAQELEQIRAESTPHSQEDLEDLLEDAWEDQEDEIRALIPSEVCTFEEESHLTYMSRIYTIKLDDAVLNFETGN